MNYYITLYHILLYYTVKLNFVFRIDLHGTKTNRI